MRTPDPLSTLRRSRAENRPPTFEDPLPRAKSILGSLTGAARLLTVLPLPRWWPEPSGPAGRATAWFPAVGAGVGVVLCSILLLPVPQPVPAAVALLASAALTGGMHEDGLMDTADAVFLPGGRERRREVLRDPRVGAFGATAAGTMLLLRFSLLATVAPVGALVAPVVGRWAMAGSLARAPALRQEGLGAAYREGARPVLASLVAALLLAAVVVIERQLATAGAPALAAGLLPPVPASGAGDVHLALRVGSAAALGGAVAWGVSAAAIRRLGGLNGDAHGAAGYLAETAALLAFLPFG